MTDKQTPPDWVLIEAAKRCSWDTHTSKYLRDAYEDDYIAHDAFRALCDMIQKYEQPPVDRKVLCAREAGLLVNEEIAKGGKFKTATDVAIRAIELWEKGFGR